MTNQQQQELAHLIAGAVNGTLDKAEQQRLDDWVARDTNVKRWLATYQDKTTLVEDLARMARFDEAADWGGVESRFRQRRARTRHHWWMRTVIALMVLPVIGWWEAALP